jgi:hypothetical protein
MRATGSALVVFHINETNLTTQTARKPETTPINQFHHTDKIKDAMRRTLIHLTK